MVNGKPQQIEAAKVSVLRAECDPSLKMSFFNCLVCAGFRHQTDAILTLARDFIAGRIIYRNGILQSQEQNYPNSPPDTPMGCQDQLETQLASGGLVNQNSSSRHSQQNSQPANPQGREGLSPPHTEANEKFKGNAL